MPPVSPVLSANLNFFAFGRLAPFAKFVENFDVFFINLRPITNNVAFGVCRDLSYVAKHRFCDLYSSSFLQKV